MPPQQPMTTKRGTRKETNLMRPCRVYLQSMFHSPFLHPLFFVSHPCSRGVPVTCSSGVPVVFWQKLFLKPKFLRTTTRKKTNMKVP